jgi:DNA-binding NtrC family response regulator
LPELVQLRIANDSLSGMNLVVALPGTVDSLAASGKLSESLADRLGDRAVALPELASRGEDLSMLLRDMLTQIGLETRQSPLGIDPPALAALIEHDFPGNDAEAYGLLFRAALAAPPDARAIGVRELEAAGFALPPDSARRTRGAGALPQAKRRRTSKSS